MTGDFERTFSRAEIDARARLARVALERNAVVMGAAPGRLVLVQSLAELWRQLIARRSRDEREA